MSSPLALLDVFNNIANTHPVLTHSNLHPCCVFYLHSHKFNFNHHLKLSKHRIAYSPCSFFVQHPRNNRHAQTRACKAHTNLSAYRVHISCHPDTLYTCKLYEQPMGTQQSQTHLSHTLFPSCRVRSACVGLLFHIEHTDASP